MSGESAHGLQERARTLALEKSILELVVRMMSRVSESVGIDDAIEQVLGSVMDVIGGTNTTLYYQLDHEIVVVDVFGRRDTYVRGSDPLVERVFDTRQPIELEGDFSQTLMQTAAFTKSFTWAYPLVAGTEVVGVLVMTDLHVGMGHLHARLPIFFTHAAHVLKNRLQNFARLQDAYERLREAQTGLETTVAERTHELRDANEQLQWELAERRRTEEALRRRNAELASANQLMAAEAADQGESELLDLACRDLAGMFEMPAWQAWSVDPDQSALLGVASSSEGPTVPTQPLGDAAVDLVRRLGSRGVWSTTVVEGAEPVVTEAAAAVPPCGATLSTVLSVPLKSDGRVIGCLLLGSAARRSCSDADYALAAGMASRLAGAIARVRARADARRLRAGIEESPDSVIITDDQARIVYVNPSFCAHSGYQRADVIGQNPRMFKSGQQDRGFYEAMWAELSAGRTWRGRLTNRKKNGELMPEDLIITPVHDSRGRLVNYLAIRRDISRELQQEERLRHAQRMEGIGQFAGGIAHDFNNILAAIIMQVDVLRLGGLSPETIDGLDDIRRSADRAATLTRQLLAFSQRQTMVVSQKDLNDVVAHVSGVVRRELPDRIGLRIEPCASPLIVSADASQIEQVLINLCLNARDAMAAGGQLTIATSAAEIDREDLSAHREARTGRFAVMRVTDTGTGMTADVRSHLFEPFFTTKGVGKGTGLGLATAHGIVRQHDGWIDVETAPGRGTTFRVYLPLKVPVVVNVPAGRTAAGGRKGSTVLVVEDEEAIRRLTTRCLEHLGFQVVTASDGVEGLRLWQANAESIDLVLTDIVMPNGVSGIELRDRIQHERPGVPVVLMSGYHDEDIRHGAALGNDAVFLPKPFTMVALGETVSRVLGGRAGAAAY